MNIIDAIKSGKRFRRIEWSIHDWIAHDRNDLPARLSRSDIIASDWEVENQPVTITREQFNAAWDRATPYNRLIDDELLELVAKELGL
jgi:hypothetical protein